MSAKTLYIEKHNKVKRQSPTSQISLSNCKDRKLNNAQESRLTVCSLIKFLALANPCLIKVLKRHPQ